MKLSELRLLNSRSTFDPFEHAADVKANPDKYVRLSDLLAQVSALRAIRHSRTTRELHKAFQGPAKLAKECGDDELLQALTGAATKRKKELEA
jgi:hypothetical protein